jgi:antitoxin YokJ
MSNVIKELIQSVRSKSGCFVRPPVGLPDVGSHRLPDDVQELYENCGGIELFPNRNFGITIVSPTDFVKANPVIAGVEGKGDISEFWYIAAKSGEQYITIDLHPQRIGRCYDSFWDRHAVAGSCPIIAKSYRELIQRLVCSSGDSWFWLDREFVNYGDAYAQQIG